MTIVVQNQSELIQADRDDCEAMILPTVVFPAPGGPVRRSRDPSSTPTRYPQTGSALRQVSRTGDGVPKFVEVRWWAPS